MTYRVQTKFRLDVNKSRIGGPKPGEDSIRTEPRILSAKWTKNNHHEADILTVTLGYKECGIDPRQLANASCVFAMWDANREDYDPERHVRFTGIAKKVERKLGDSSSIVEMTFHDYTTLFLGMKPFKPEGIPEWTDTLRQAWEKICDFTGWEDPANGKIVSVVGKLRDRIRFFPPELESRVVGAMVSKRFLAVSKPTPPQRCDAWAVWRWVCESLGLVTFIDRDECIVSKINEFYRSADGASQQTDPALAVYGRNIWDFEEAADVTLTQKGILLKAFDPLNGRMIESFYPKPGDPRIKTKRSAAGKKSEEGANITANEVSGQYDEYSYNWIIDQKALDAKCQSAFEERHRQQLKGKFKTADMFLPTAVDGRGVPEGEDIDILSLRSGAAVTIVVEKDNFETLFAIPEEQRVQHLVDVAGYDRGIAQLYVENLYALELQSPTFHVTSLSMDYADGKFEVEIEFHNLIIEIDLSGEQEPEPRDA